MIVEDNKVNQEVAHRYMERLSYQPILSNNGRDAIQKLRERSFDLILMNCQMPKMDGYEATRRIRSGEAGSENKNIYIVAMTANAMKGDRQKCMEAGMNGYLSKPMKIPELQKALENCANGIKLTPKGDSSSESA